MSHAPSNENPQSLKQHLRPLKDSAKGAARSDTISLGKRLRKSSIPCVGICPNWCDFPEEVKRALMTAATICYPGPVYEEVFQAAGKSIFPKNYYHFLGNKIAQTNLFQLLEIPHPRTGIYYGRNQSERICNDFRFPFVGKTPVGSSRGEGVFLIRDPGDLLKYLDNHNPAYVQEYFPIDRDLRVVVITGKVIHAYWRVHRKGDFRNNVAQGGAISFDGIPAEALEFGRKVAAECGFDEVGLDICEYGGKYYVLEANMVFGLEGFRKKGMDIYGIIAGLFDADR